MRIHSDCEPHNNTEICGIRNPTSHTAAVLSPIQRTHTTSAVDIKTCVEFCSLETQLHGLSLDLDNNE